MKCSKKARLYAAHVIVPLLLGFGIYVHSTGSTYITETLDFALPEFLTSPPKRDVGSSFLLRVFRFYFCDAAWAYSLTFSTAPFIGTTKSRILRAIILCACFCIFLELMQRNPGFTGTFDPLDIIAEVISCFIAGTIFYKLFGRQ